MVLSFRVLFIHKSSQLEIGYRTHSKLRSPFLLVRFSYKYGGGLIIEYVYLVSFIRPPFLDMVVCNSTIT